MTSNRLTILNVIAFAINFLVVGLSNFGVWGKTNAEISDSIPTLVTPIGYAFSIWGVIFASETAFVVWQALPSNRGNPAVRYGLKYWFSIGCLLQALWSIVFAREYIIVSSVVLLLLAVSLGIAIAGATSHITNHVSYSEILFLYFPIGLHAGWVCAASLVNVSLALVYNDVSLAVQVATAILTIFLCAFFACLFDIKFKSTPFLLAVCWALFGIGENKDYRNVLLGTDISEGFYIAIVVVCISLLVLATTVFIAHKVSKA